MRAGATWTSRSTRCGLFFPQEVSVGEGMSREVAARAIRILVVECRHGCLLGNRDTEAIPRAS